MSENLNTPQLNGSIRLPLFPKPLSSNLPSFSQVMQKHEERANKRRRKRQQQPAAGGVSQSSPVCSPPESKKRRLPFQHQDGQDEMPDVRSRKRRKTRDSHQSRLDKWMQPCRKVSDSAAEQAVDQSAEQAAAGTTTAAAAVTSDIVLSVEPDFTLYPAEECGGECEDVFAIDVADLLSYLSSASPYFTDTTDQADTTSAGTVSAPVASNEEAFALLTEVFAELDAEKEATADTELVETDDDDDNDVIVDAVVPAPVRPVPQRQASITDYFVVRKKTAADMDDKSNAETDAAIQSIM